MRYNIRHLYLALAITFFVGLVQCQINEPTNTTANGNQSSNIPELPAKINLTSEVYELNPTAIAVFGDEKIEPAKQEIYKINVINEGEVPLNDVTVSIEAAECSIFKNIAYYDELGKLQKECIQDDLCKGTTTKLFKNLGGLKLNETKSLYINAYIKPKFENKNINIKAVGAKPNGSVSCIRNIVELAKCIFVNENGVPCAEELEGCICKRPDWTETFLFVDLAVKPLINLSQIVITNTISGIRTIDQQWKAPTSLKNYEPNIGDLVIYRISVFNMDKANSLKNISIVDQLPNGMNYLSSSAIEGNSTNRQILPINGSGKTITWEIDEIKPNEEAIINLEAVFLRNEPIRYENKAYAEGTWDTDYAFVKDRSEAITSIIDNT